MRSSGRRAGVELVAALLAWAGRDALITAYRDDTSTWLPSMPSRFQFSIRWILALIAGVAACCGLWVAAPTWWLGIVVFGTNLVLPPICWIAYLAATGHARAFWLGVSFSTTIAAEPFFFRLHLASHVGHVAGISFIGVRDFLIVSATLRYPSLLICLSAPLVGLCCAGFHSLLERGHKSRAE